MASHNIGVLINRQIRRWEVQRRAEGPPARPPCIAVSRLPRSGGAQIGQRVAELLDYGFFGSEIVDRIASERGIQRQLVEGLDERIHGTIDRFVADAFRDRPFTESDYLWHVVRTIATLGNRGMAVILGRGAPFILAPERALRVLVVAPTPVRIERLAKAEVLGPERAAEVLAQEDKRRREFLRHQFGVQQDNPRLYDLTVNTGTLSIDAAAEIVVDALGHRFPETPRASRGRRT
jgi:cytidylate kinase